MHPKYSTKLKKNDIGLIRLTERLWLTELIHPICLETNLMDEDASVELIVTGWGQTECKLMNLLIAICVEIHFNFYCFSEQYIERIA